MKTRYLHTQSLIPLLLITLISSLTTYAQTHRPEVGLKNGTVIYPGLLKLKDPMFGSLHLVVNDTGKIRLDQVDYYQTSSEYFIIRDIGLASNLPLKRIETGTIPVFVYQQVVHNSNMGPNGMMMMGSQVRTDYYYLKDDDLKRVKMSNLKRDLWNYPASRAKLKKAGQQRWVKIGLWVTGAAVLVAGLNQMVNEANEGGPPYDEAPKLNAPIVIGAGMVIAPFFIKNSQQENLLDAIRVYNAGM